MSSHGWKRITGLDVPSSCNLLEHGFQEKEAHNCLSRNLKLSSKPSELGHHGGDRKLCLVRNRFFYTGGVSSEHKTLIYFLTLILDDRNDFDVRIPLHTCPSIVAHKKYIEFYGVKF